MEGLKFLNKITVFTVSMFLFIGCHPTEVELELQLEKQAIEEPFTFADYCKEEYDSIFLVYPYFNTVHIDYTSLKMSNSLRGICNANINFEKLSKEDIAYEQFFDINELGDFIANLISKLKDKIESFSDTNIVDPIFNGRLLDKTKSYLSHMKKEGLICVILTPPLTAFTLWGLIYSFVDKNYKIENPAGFYTAIICCSAFSILFFILMIYGIKLLVQRRKFKKDYDLKSFLTICEFPNKVKIVKEKPGKYSDNFYLISAILYFNKIKLIIPFDGELILNKQNIKKCCEECKKIKSEIKYLSKSRIIIDGEKQFIKIIKKQIL